MSEHEAVICLLCPIIPNAETIEAMEAAGRGEMSGPFDTIEELMAHLNSDEDDQQ